MEKKQERVSVVEAVEEQQADHRRQSTRWHEVVILAGLELIPGIGGAISTVVGEVFERRREQVREVGVQILSEAPPGTLIECLQADPRFGDLFVRALERCANTRWEVKRRAMGRVVIQALLDEDTLIDHSERLLRALDEMNSADFSVLARLHAKTVGGSDSVDVDGVRGLSESLGELLRHGAVSTSSGLGSLMYRSTPFAEKLLALVEMAATDDEPHDR